MRATRTFDLSFAAYRLFISKGEWIGLSANNERRPVKGDMLLVRQRAEEDVSVLTGDEVMAMVVDDWPIFLISMFRMQPIWKEDLC